MGRFTNKKVKTIGPKSVITNVGTGRTYEGGRGVTRDAKSELFLLAASFMGGDSNFYEKEDERYARLIHLVSTNEVVTDLVWLFDFVNWLRSTANMRTVAMVIALEAVRVRVANGMVDPVHEVHGSRVMNLANRDLVGVALNRGDEPAEALAYWLAKYGKPIPQPVKNGIADAAVRIYNEYSFLKYGESRSATVKMIDVLRMTHPTPKDSKQDALFCLITKSAEVTGPESLPMVYYRKQLYGMKPENRRTIEPWRIKQAGMTWENLSEWLPGGMDAEAWELAIPNMGIMALIRNLRNFDQAGISPEKQYDIMKLITDPLVVERSRQLPFRWYNAYRATDSLTWASALETALGHSLKNVPTFSGKTLVLVDMSGSMFQGRVSERSSVTYADAASLFGTAIKLRNPHNVDLYQYGSEFNGLVGRYQDHLGNRFSNYGSKAWTGVTKRIEVSAGASVLRAMGNFHDMGGTETHKAFAELNENDSLSKYNRIILLTDEQSFGWGARSVDYDNLPVPNGTKLYVWNLAGYRVGTSASGRYNRHTFGGLSDSAFKLIPILESGKNTGWPWEVESNANGVS